MKTKPILTHAVAVAVGVVGVLLLRPISDDSKNSADESQAFDQVKRGMGDSAARPATGGASRIDQRSGEHAKKMTAANLESWLESKKADARALAEAQAITGMLTGNPDLIRQAIEADPHNPHLLYMGATLSSFTKEERLALSERFFQQDRKNGLAAYIYAAQLFANGDAKKGVEVLSSAQDRPGMEAFATQRQLLMEDAFIAAGFSPREAKIQSFLAHELPYYSDLHSLAGSINGLGDSLPADEAASLRTLSATMGMRLTEQSSTGTLLDYLIGLKLEEKTLAGLSNDAPSPYDGLTVGQARQEIISEREQLNKLREQAPLEVIMSSDQELVDRYFERVQLMGEMEATKWWLSTTGGKK